MKTIKRSLMMLAAMIGLTGAWAQSTDEPISLTSTDGKTWTLAEMPAYDVELEVEYKTDLTLTLSLNGWAYGATANTPTLSGNEGSGDVTYSYKVKDAADDTYSATVPTVAGNYTVRAIVAETDDYADGTATADFTIAAADIPATDITAPTAKTLNFTGQAQALIVAGSVAGGIGTLKYSLDGTTWSTDIPTGTDEGDYTVYYKVVGDDNHNDVAAQSLAVTIGAALPIELTYDATAGGWTYSQPAYDVELEVVYKTDLTLTLSLSGWTYGATDNTPTLSGNAGDGDVTYSYKVKDAADDTYSTTVPTDAGNYTVRAIVAETDDYADGTATADFTIAAADIPATDITAPTAKTLNFTGQAQALIVAGSVAGGIGTMQYSLDGTTWGTDIPTGTDEGDYTVYYKVVGDDNHNDVDAATIPVTISAALPVDLTSTDGKTWTLEAMPYYDVELEVEYYPAATVTTAPTGITADVTGSNQPLVSGGVASGGTFQYALGADNTTVPTTDWTSTVPQKAAYGTYHVWYKVVGDETHSDSDPACVTSTINQKEVQASWIQDIAAVTYTGSALQPTVTVKDGSYTLVAGTDYTVSYADNVDAGTGNVTITGNGNYTGTASKNFTINKANITASANNRSYTYDGSSHSITVSVTMPTSGYTIQYSTDNSSWSTTKPGRTSVGTSTIYYKVTAPNYNDKTGSATVTVTRATGSIAFNPTEVTKTWGDPDFTKTYSSKTGNGSITYSSDNADVATVTNSGVVTIKAAGTAHIKVSMAQSTNYTSASATYTLTVNPVDLSAAEIALDQTSFEYDGTEKKPDVKFAILNETTVLKAGTDYTVSYADNVNAGTATATITGIGNYTGTASQTFTITSVTTTNGNVTVVDGGSETVLTINDMGNQQGKTVTPDLQVTTLNYYRSLNASDVTVYTVCLPYAPPTDAGLTYYTLTGAEGTTLLFDEITGTPQANTPYLVFASSTTDIGTENLNQAITMSQTVSNSVSAGGYVMKGTLSGFTHDQSVGKYILQSGNRWGLVGSDTHAYIPPFRAYIEATVSGARMLDSSFGGDATGINSLRTTDRDGTERYFDLNGRRIENPKKAGVYIRNGRKEVLK